MSCTNSMACPGSPAFLVRRPDEGLPLASQAQHAVLSRRPADPEQVAGYVASRLRRPSIAMPMTIAMSAPPRGLARVAFGVRWLAGRLSSLGDLEPVGVARGVPPRHRCRQPPPHQRASGGADGPRSVDAPPATAAPRRRHARISTASTPGGNGSSRASCARTVACCSGRWKAKRPHLGGRGT